ncbi:MAG: vWA domain-containing protein [Pirellulaceae bacterium]
MFDWEFGDPWFLLLMGLAPLAYGLARRSSSLLGYSSLTLLVDTRRSWRQRLSRLPAILLALAVIALVASLARPRTPQRETRVTREGIAIMMVVDLSSSMDARDMVEDDRSVNRLDVVKDVFVDFVLGTDRTAGRGRPDDLIGIVSFARYADSLCPLTLDHGNLVNMVQDLEIVSQRQEDGTAVGDGLGLAVERLRRSRAKSRIAILLTDGVTNAGVIDPLKAAELASQFDIKVYCIGAGTRGVAPTPAVDFFGRATLVPRPVEIDEAALKQIAEKTGGKYFRAVDMETLANIYRDIDTLERTEVTEVKYLQYAEHFPYFVGSGLSLLACAMLLGGSLFRRLP